MNGCSFGGCSCGPCVLTILGQGGARLGLVPLSTLLETLPERWSCCLWSVGLSPRSEQKRPKVKILVAPTRHRFLVS